MSHRIIQIFLVIIIASVSFSTGFIGNSSADSTVVCCDTSHSVELYLIGDINGELTPFSQKLSDESSSAVIANSITSEEEVGIWSLGKVWPGSITEGNWEFSINYRVSDAGGAQINATATIMIGSESFSDSTSLEQSVLTQGEGSISFSIPVEAMSVSASSKVELVLSARSLVFSVPGSNAELEFLWGSTEFSSSISADIPLMELSIDEPIVEGSDIYISAIIDSHFGIDALAYSESIELLVDGTQVSGDPIETQRGDSILVTWTWSDSMGGTETIRVTVRLNLQDNGPLIQGSSEFIIETTDTGGGTGTFYPSDEPLRTSGTGSPLAINQIIDLSKMDGELKLTMTTSMEIGGEMAFWMRWGMDHIGDKNLQTSSVLYGWDAGGVSEDNRESRTIENVELEQFERQMVKHYRTYMTDINGMQIDSEELIGSLSDFTTISVSVDLLGESKVVNHPLVLTFSTLQPVNSGERFDLVRSFTTAQTAPIWQDFSINIEAKSSVITSFGSSDLLESDSLSFSHLRLPWGEKITVESNKLSTDEDFTLYIQPVDSLLFSPMPLTIIISIIILFGLITSLSMTARKHKRFLMLELILIPIVGLVYFFSYPPNFVTGSAVATSVIWILTSIVSPKRLEFIKEEEDNNQIIINVPTIKCPACDTMSPVTSDVRPLKITCSGCGKTIKIVS